MKNKSQKGWLYLGTVHKKDTKKIVAKGFCYTERILLHCTSTRENDILTIKKR